jgi:hypothetical protein
MRLISNALVALFDLMGSNDSTKSSSRSTKRSNDSFSEFQYWLALRERQPRVISLDHKSQRSENYQRDEKPAQAAGKIGGGLNGNTEYITETEISR